MAVMTGETQAHSPETEREPIHRHVRSRSGTRAQPRNPIFSQSAERIRINYCHAQRRQ